MIADLHMHSTFSDGKNTPSEVVRRAIKNGVGMIALTDHDSVLGCEEFIMECNKYKINGIYGVELSTRYNDESIHILGYFPNYPSNNFIGYLNEVKSRRMKRAKEMILKLKKYFDIDISYDDLIKHSNGIIARPHIAQTIIDSGYKFTKEEIFTKMIGEDNKAYVPTTYLDTKEGIKLLKMYGALTVLAHPILYKKTKIEEFVKMGIDGIEAIYPSNEDGDTMRFTELAKYYNLLITAGSDFHGFMDKNHHDIGTVYMNDNLIKIFLDKLFGGK